MYRVILKRYNTTMHNLFSLIDQWINVKKIENKEKKIRLEKDQMSPSNLLEL